MSRQLLNCPGAEGHEARLAHIKTLGTVGAARQYLIVVKAENGLFWSDYLESDFNAWLQATKEAQACQAS